MRSTFFLLIGSMFLISLAPGSLSGCTDTCTEDLQAICDRCTDLDYKESCEATVADGNQSLCDARKPTFNNQCPFVEPTTTTTTAGGGGTAGAGGTTTTTTTGTAGAGGTGGAGGAGGAGGTGGAGGSGGTGG